MTSGNVDARGAHWVYMPPVTPGDTKGLLLPGDPTTGVSDVTGLQTDIIDIDADRSSKALLGPGAGGDTAIGGSGVDRLGYRAQIESALFASKEEKKRAASPARSAPADPGEP